MTTYARVLDGMVQEIFDMPPMMVDRPIKELFNPDTGQWVDVSSVDPKPAWGWSYDGKTFEPPPPIESGEARTLWARKMGYDV